MRRLLLIGLLCLLPAMPSLHAQDATAVPVDVTVSFDELPLFTDCLAAINTHRPDLLAEVAEMSDFGLPRIAESGDASGRSPECELPPRSVIRITLNRPATRLSFNRYGAAGIELWRDGQLIQPVDQSSGLGGRYERTDFNGFDTIILRENSGTTPLLLDELTVHFPSPAVTTRIDFTAFQPETLCDAAINQTTTLAATAETDSAFGPLMVGLPDDGPPLACHFPPSYSLTLDLGATAIGLRYEIYGGALLVPYSDGTQLGAGLDIQGLPVVGHWTRGRGFDQLILSEPSGFSSFQLRWLEITYPLHDATTQTVTFDEAQVGSGCEEAFANVTSEMSATATNQPEFGGPFIVDETNASGQTPECNFAPGSSLTVTLNRPAAGIIMDVSDGPFVELLRDGEVVIAIQTGPQPTRFMQAAAFDTLILTESRFSSFRLDNLTVIWAEE